MTAIDDAVMALYHPRLAFGEPDDGPVTVGAEEELLLVRPDTGAPAPVAQQLLEHLNHDPRFALEFRTGQIETASPVRLTAHDVVRELAAARAALATAAPEIAAPVAVPVHPTATAPTPVTPLERYEAIARDAPWAALELETCGLHVHLGISGAERALAVTNALRSHLPLLAGLAASSPFYRGAEAGVASTRARLNRALPRHGIPPAFPTWEAYEAFLRWGTRTGVVPDPSYHWYDLRLNVVQGTVEVRVFDVQADSADAGALVALTHALATALARRHDEGEQLPVHETHLIDENLRLVERDGSSGHVVDLETGRLVETRAAIAALVAELRPTARELGGESLLDRVEELAMVGGADRQRLIAAAHGPDGLVRWLAGRTAPPALATA